MRKYPVGRYLVTADITIRDALQRIEETERRTVFVVDEKDRLRGVVTDGDIRRWLLDGGAFTVALNEVANPNPIFVRAGFAREALRERMIEMGATCVPRVDNQMRVVEMIFWEDIFLEHDVHPDRQPIDTPIVIMAGGRGTRMAPFTQVLPKPLLPVGEKTVIEVIIDRFLDYGVRDFYVTLNYKANLIRAFFKDLARGYRVHFVEEDRPLGTAGSLGLLKDQLTQPFIMTNCDMVIQADYHDLLQQHEQQENQITLVVSLKNYNVPYGVCEIANGGRLEAIREKPEFNFLVNTGMYAISPAVFDHVRTDGLFHMTDLIAAVREAGGRVGVYPIGDRAWLDTGEWAEYKRTVRHFERLFLT